ncbi:hypothetical protein KIN20_005873 [Parelaphostrongylus tenuis]|uniref:Uncharacterized protein n=1 Tax=Parelaphostrongylus tenuis TaxID=148309 RepID=A0AAD5M2T2_PARTN|nr:hypothetical protein KIN20_005873 [Parelaphostrongylus tenuis]
MEQRNKDLHVISFGQLDEALRVHCIRVHVGTFIVLWLSTLDSRRSLWLHFLTKRLFSRE